MLQLLQPFDPALQLIDLSKSDADHTEFLLRFWRNRILNDLIRLLDKLIQMFLLPFLQLINLIFPNTALHIFMHGVYLLGQDLSFAHVEIDYLLLLLSLLDFVNQLIFENLVVCHRTIKISFHRFRHFQGLSCQLFELLLKDIDPIVDVPLVLA